jgi:hypothetical protein
VNELDGVDSLDLLEQHGADEAIEIRASDKAHGFLRIDSRLSAKSLGE